jgi:hypothetical protein
LQQLTKLRPGITGVAIQVVPAVVIEELGQVESTSVVVVVVVVVVVDDDGDDDDVNLVASSKLRG